MPLSHSDLIRATMTPPTDGIPNPESIYAAPSKDNFTQNPKNKYCSEATYYI